MSAQLKSLDELVRELPPEHQAEVRDFAEFLLTRKKTKAVRFAAEDIEPDPFVRLFGSWNSGDPHSGDNERIDADLAREYGDTHEAKS